MVVDYLDPRRFRVLGTTVFCILAQDGYFDQNWTPIQFGLTDLILQNVFLVSGFCQGDKLGVYLCKFFCLLGRQG